MTPIRSSQFGRGPAQLCAVAALPLLLLLLAGCAGQRNTVTPNFYRFEVDTGDSMPMAIAASPAPTPQAGASAPGTPLAGAPRPLPTLIVNPVQAAAGYDSAHIVYQREPHRQERFAYNEWVDTPARMLTPPLMAALSKTGAFRAVVPTPSAAAGDLRLDVEIVQLVQDFSVRPSSVRLVLHAYLVDDTSRRVLAWRDIRAQAVARSDDPAGGVAAANQAVRQALAELAQFSVQVARDWRPGGALATIPR